ncbi:MAG: phosphoglucosamine mutase [Alphaproteobacteria bacterium]|nr:phosphoglucosamine mutase [Alphaproteobacteria bacterium]
MAKIIIGFVKILKGFTMACNKWFGTDGVRGVANEFPMVSDFAMKLAFACAQQVCVNHKKVAIAKDTRISGDMLEASLIAGFTSQGVDVVKFGVVPTPAVTTFVSELDVDMAVMITASHNPYHDNGIKLIASNGDKFADEVTSQLENLIEQNNFVFDKDKLGRVFEDYSIKEKYKQIAYDMYGNTSSLKGMKIVADCANGVFSDILPEVLRNLGAEVVEVGVEPNGVNINRDCGSQHPEKMLEAIVKNNADLGVAVDGDGDRIKVGDNNGKLIKSEQLMAFLATYMQEIGENKGRAFASTKLSNTALERYITQNLGLQYISTGVGERPVIKALKENGGVIGGEESGHIVLLDYAKSGDAMMTFLKVLQGLAQKNKKASEIFPLFKDDFLYFENFKVKSNEMVKIITSKPELKNLVDDLSSKINGHGRVVIHPSGTEPKIRVWVCGDDEQTVQDFGTKLWNTIEHLNAD